MRVLPIPLISLACALTVLPWAAGADSVHAQIDQAIAAAADGPLAAPASDAEFLRRAYLDFAGTIPTAAEARSFLADTTGDKRTKLVDRLIAAPEFPERLEQAVTVMLLERHSGGKIPEKKWRTWLRAQFEANRPWNEIVHDLLACDGDVTATPAAKFMTNEEKFDSQKAAGTVARLFLGMNLQCAQCHDHPTVKGFKQADFYGIYTYLAQTNLTADKTSRSLMLAETPATGKIEFKSVFKSEKESTLPHMPVGKGGVVPAFAPCEGFEVKGSSESAEPKFRLRPMMAIQVTADQRFAKNSVNRFWFLLMGRGLVHPLDMLHEDNPSAPPALLDQLAGEFVVHKFDLRWLLREIALSEAYQRASRGPAGVDPKTVKPESYRVANFKPLSAEQIGPAAMVAAGATEWPGQAAAPAPEETAETKDDAPKTKRGKKGGATQIPVTREESLATFVRAFAGPDGEPETEFTPSMEQSLFLMNEPMVIAWLKPKASNLVARLASLSSPAEIADELYLSVLTRPPETEEVAEVGAFLEKSGAHREEALGELAWALLASAEFRVNH